MDKQCELLAVSHPFNKKGTRNLFQSSLNNFLSGASIAFDNHLQFTIAPQHLMLLITQAIGKHVSKHSEELQDKLVRHSGKKMLVVEVPRSSLTCEEWKSTIQNFDAQIKENTVHSTQELLSLSSFSTASENEILAGSVALMDMCSSYFDYGMRTMCGIPYFRLEGTVEDWAILRGRAEAAITQMTLPAFSSRWLPAILPVLDRMLEARRDGTTDIPFWQSFFKRGSVHGSGGYTYLSGWVNVFFPIVEVNNNLVFNSFCEPYEQGGLYLSRAQRAEGGTETDLEAIKAGQMGNFGFRHRDGTEGCNVNHFPSGISVVPVKWTSLGITRELNFLSGFIGSAIQEKKSKKEVSEVRPEVGWWCAE